MRKIIFFTTGVVILVMAVSSAGVFASDATTGTDDVELAKIILTPKQYELHVSRDPFEPLIRPQTKGAVPFQKGDEGVGMPVDVKFFGVVKTDQGYAALLKSPEEKGVYRIGDMMKDFLISDIQMDYLVITYKEKTYTLKRGDETWTKEAPEAIPVMPESLPELPQEFLPESLP